MKILLTGGLGYIGSHAVSLIENNYEVVIIDNLCNSNLNAINNIHQITNKKVKFYEGDILDNNILNKIFNENSVDLVIHLAGFKSVSHSHDMPIDYYENNVMGSISLIKAMNNAGIKNLIFSSSATVYGVPETLPIDENHPTNPTNPYGKTKLQVESILKDICKNDKSWNVVSLRYFNPVGAHESGLIGENPINVPNNLMPYIFRVLNGESKYLSIFGNDYDTKDGTGERDYIHVMDIAEGHLAALKNIFNTKEKNSKIPNYDIYNLSTGNPLSVLDIIESIQSILDIKIPYKIVSRRKGDVAKCYARSDKANKFLNWYPKRKLDHMLSSGINFSKKNNKE